MTEDDVPNPLEMPDQAIQEDDLPTRIYHLVRRSKMTIKSEIDLATDQSGSGPQPRLVPTSTTLTAEQDYSAAPSANHDDWYSFGLRSHLFEVVGGSCG